ncbi:MAG: Na(+)-translocating NADH-quinone reductase subunit C [Gammaproteobacteria bacterium]|uniref:Na(+)-translocating NADH-quinone reductase subunit C n=1 Tax=OM182 bacterium TaxID=2510334 RepID=A0A520RZU4_9GAMM|nr:Na(+)-translocating NADH-quinone reductase subunit C [Gammaproteobacteria bacterium]RZO75741.1 MAG: Na(+)-translocating NADH-quinone reductase subunit C [OM182 bacterium]
MRNILIVALSVCFVCSVVVSGAAVSLKPERLANKELDRNKNILIAAGLFEKGVTNDSQVDNLFKSFEVRVVDLQTHQILTLDEIKQTNIDFSRYDQRKAAKDRSMSVALSTTEDIASISTRANYSIIYLLKRDGELQRVVLPVHGYGLWSTLYGFISVQADGNTVSGITFYEHQETAGLGGEVDNPRWKGLWPGKKIYDEKGNVALEVIKGSVVSGSSKEKYQVDGLSGATLTSRGVSNLVEYWLGDQAFGPVLKKLGGKT